MRRIESRHHPPHTVLLSAIVTDLGHLYLRRWLRAFGWLAVTIGAAVLFVPAGTVEAVMTSGAVDPVAVLPVFMLSVASSLDA